MSSCCSEKNEDHHSSVCRCSMSSDEGHLDSDFSIFVEKKGDRSCCTVQATETSAPVEIPGYRLWKFVEEFLETPVGMVPKVRTLLTFQDRWGTVRVRSGFGRDRYRIAPGLYAVGAPDETAPVLVTANFKLSFDLLRSHLSGVNMWVLVVDTKGINVWCAAGKGTFSSEEVARRVTAAQLDRVVTHRRLILPQFAATGVAARKVKRLCGFEVCWGPIHCRDLKRFFDGGMKATKAMRQATFSLAERAVLIPVEIRLMAKPTLYVLPALFLLSGIGPGLFSLGTAVSRGSVAFLAYLFAVVAGTVATPIFLPWLPGRAFAVKGAISGIAVGVLMATGFGSWLSPLEMVAVSLLILAVGSFLAMNFTGCTPFTSPTGVEKEMRRAIPVQAVGVVIAAILWVVSGFY